MFEFRDIFVKILNPFWHFRHSWPKEVVLIRHGESVYNAFRKILLADPLFQKFKKLFDRDYSKASPSNLDWVTSELKKIALQIMEKYPIQSGNRHAPLSQMGRWQSVTSSRNAKLMGKLSIPDVIISSEYDRAIQTLEGWQEGWQELKDSSIIVHHDDRIREQEYGISNIYPNWRLMFVFNPLQAVLYKLNGAYDYRHPGGESKLDVQLRLKDVFQTLIREHSGTVVWLICHNMTILNFRRLMEHWTPEKYMLVSNQDAPRNSSITHYTLDRWKGRKGKMELNYYNEILYDEACFKN